LNELGYFNYWTWRENILFHLQESVNNKADIQGGDHNLSHIKKEIASNNLSATSDQKLSL
jgi:hypothetical protein